MTKKPDLNITAALTLNEQQKPVKMDSKKAVAIMSEGFIRIMTFLREHGLPKDLTVEAMRQGGIYGLCQQTNGMNTDGTVYMSYSNPYRDWLDKPATPEVATPAPEAAND